MSIENYQEDKIEISNESISEEDVFSEKEIMDKIEATKMAEIMDDIYEKAINGIPKVSRSVDETVNDYMSRFDDPRAAAKELAKYQIAKCGTSGFISGLGGIITLPVAIPANVGSVLYVQLRMIAAIAQMGGFDIRSDQVQTMAYACLTGSAVADIIKQTGIKIGKKISEAAIAKIPGKVLTAVNQKVGFRMITKFGSKGAVNLVELIPVAGGVIGGTIDVASTKIIAENAITIFIDKEVPEERKSIGEQVGETAKNIKETVKPMAEKGADTIGKATSFLGEKAKPIADNSVAGLAAAKDKVSGGFTNLSSSIKAKRDEIHAEKSRVKLTVQEVIPDKIDKGRLCHVIASPKKILLSWDYFVDEHGNQYAVYDAVDAPSKDKKYSMVYYVEFEDQRISFPEGTILFAGEDKWKKALPDSDLVNVSLYVANISLVEMIEDNKTISPENAEVTVFLEKEGRLSVDRKEAVSLKYDLGKKNVKKVFEELKNCITAGDSRPYDPDDGLSRLLVLRFDNGEEVTYEGVRGAENGPNTRDVISNLLKMQGLNIEV